MVATQYVKYLEEITDFQDWARVCHEVIDKIEDSVTSDNITHLGKPQVHESAKIHRTVIILPGVVIEEGVTIGPYCYIKANAYIGKGCKLGYNVEVSASILLENTKVSHSACVTNSVIGKKCNLGYGFVTASRHLISNRIKVFLNENEIIYSNMRHHGCVLGNYVEAGVNVSIMPGTTVGQHSKIFPHSCVSGYVPKNSQMFHKPKWMLV